MKICAVIIFSLIVRTTAYADPLQSDGQGIRKFDFKKYFLSLDLYRDCPEQVKKICEGSTDTDYCPSGLSLSAVYADLTGDGIEEAVVQGSSCGTGTAGPDIHKVYSLTGNGEVKELDLADPAPKVYEVLVGNRNYSLVVESNKLIARFWDTSGRMNPLAIKYEWDGERFLILSLEIAPPSTK